VSDLQGVTRLRKIKVILGSGKQRLKSLRLAGIIRSFDELASGEIPVNGLAEIELSREARPDGVGILAHIENTAFDILNQIVVPAVTDAGSQGWEKLPNGVGLIGFRFVEALAGNLEIQILGTRKSQSGW
jgi:hypothetical protein